MARSRAKPPPRRGPIHRVDRRIRVREVRVIGPDGTQLGIMPTAQALQEAADANLNLVEVNSNANPPVCKIMDYGKFKYETAKKEREGKKNKKSQELKEVKFRPKTHDHDFDFKVKHARRFLEEGNKVRLLIQFRGREVTHPEIGKVVLDRVCAALADVSTINSISAMEGNRMNMVLAPKPNRSGGIKRPRPADAGGTAPADVLAGSPGADGALDSDEHDDDLDEDDDDEDLDEDGAEGDDDDADDEGDDAEEDAPN